MTKNFSYTTNIHLDIITKFWTQANEDYIDVQAYIIIPF